MWNWEVQVGKGEPQRANYKKIAGEGKGVSYSVS